MSRVKVPTGRRMPARAKCSLFALTIVTIFSLLSSGVPAHADDLKDQAEQLKQQAQDVRASLEFVDAEIAQAAGDLTKYSGMLPGAQQELSDAQGRVATATGEVESLSARLGLAQQNKAKITAEIEATKAKSAESEKTIGQIATQTYKSGGVPSSLNVLLGSNGLTQRAESVALANQALQAQTTTVSALNQKRAADTNTQARLTAVEGEISDLKGKADAALAVQQAAQEEAAKKQADLTQLVNDTTKLRDELNAKRPQIESKLSEVKKQQGEVANQIAEQQRKEREAYEAEQRRKAAAQGQTYTAEVPSGSVAGAPSAFGLIAPFPGAAVTSGWGWRTVPPGTIDFTGTGAYQHTGIDYGVGCGTPVRAPADGRVTTAGWLSNGGGNSIMLSHGIVAGNALTTVFYHNSSVSVSVGQEVKQGQVLGFTGSTGNSTGCHAHFETWFNGKPVNPAGLL